MRQRILVADDEKEIVSLLQDALWDEGYEVLTAYDGHEAVCQARKQPDLILLDIMMPGRDGFEVCQTIREVVQCPIIFLSARQSEMDRVQGLAIGGDDYVVKPFSLRELKARINAHLRREKRATEGSRPLLRFGSLEIDLNGHTMSYNNTPVVLTGKEFSIVRLLALHPSQVFSREQIYEQVWGLDAVGDDATVTEHIKKIRAKLAAADPQHGYISTVWGIGYKWEYPS